jgi:GntR family transcriptional regulator
MARAEPNLEVSPPTKLSVLQRAKKKISEMIQDTDLSPGDRILSERVLAERLGISRMTIRKAIVEMVASGQLERRSTAGTYIPELAVVRPLSKQVSTAMSEVVGFGGKESGARLLFFEQQKANENIASRLRLEVGAIVIVIKRLRLSDGMPFCIETSYLPEKRVSGLVAADVVDIASLYSYLRERYGLTFAQSDFHVSVVSAPEAEAKLLGLGPQEKSLVMRSTVYDVGQYPVEHLISWNHPERVAFESLHDDFGSLKSVFTDWAASTENDDGVSGINAIGSK